jgi:hypothetical protein
VRLWVPGRAEWRHLIEARKLRQGRRLRKSTDAPAQDFNTDVTLIRVLFVY